MVSKTIDRGSIPFFPVSLINHFIHRRCPASSSSGGASGLGPEGYEFKSHLADLLVINIYS